MHTEAIPSGTGVRSALAVLSLVLLIPACSTLSTRQETSQEISNPAHENIIYLYECDNSQRKAFRALQLRSEDDSKAVIVYVGPCLEAQL